MRGLFVSALLVLLGGYAAGKLDNRLGGLGLVVALASLTLGFWFAQRRRP